MASGRGSSKDPPLTECERWRNENIAEIQEKLKSFNIPTLSNPKPPAKKRAKVIFLEIVLLQCLYLFNENYLHKPCFFLQRTHKTNDGETHDHNLRPRPQTNPTVNVNEQIEEDLDCEQIDEDWECEAIGDFLGDNEGIVAYSSPFLLLHQLSACA